MIDLSKPIKRVFYCASDINEKRFWKLTTNMLEAQTYQIWHLAKHDDLNDWGCVGGFFFDTYLLLDEGLFEWCPYTRINFLGELERYGEYEMATNVKEVILDILEDMRLENTDAYELIIGYSNWKVRKFLDCFDLNLDNITSSIELFNKKVALCSHHKTTA